MMGVVTALRVRVLGGFEVEGVDTPRLGSRKARIVLKVLALARSKPVTAEFLADCVWPEGLPARPGDQLAVLVSRLRAALGAEALVRSEAGYVLAVQWLDVDAMSSLIDESRRRLAAGNTTAAAVAAAAAVTLARGPLLPEDDEAPWAEADRAAAARMAAAARRLSAEAALKSSDFVGAALLAQGALDDDRFDEPALATLMTALALSGRPATALAAYADMRARLRDELGVDPTNETEAIHRAILLGESLSPPDAAADVVTRGSSTPGPVAEPPGRRDSIAALDRALDAARGGRGGLIVIQGEAGMGKSHLVDAWAARIAASATVLVGRCNELSRGTPLQVIVGALEEYLRGLDPEAAAKVLGSESDVLRPLMAPFAAAPEVSAAALRDWGGGQLVTFASIVAVLARLPPPTVVVLDDVHLGGAATIEWLDYAARRAGALTLVLVATQRPEEGVALPAGTVVDLQPLDEAAAAEIVGPVRAAALVARSGGNTFFLVELASADSDAMPVSIQEAVAARCERAGPAAATTLRTAAVIGQEIDLDLLASVLRSPPIDLLDHLEEGARRGLLVETAGQFVFRHQLVREALAEATSAARRALAHREVGRALAARPGRDAYAIAHHARLGGDDELAARALLEAAELASARFDQNEALALADAALEAGAGAPALVLRARVRMMLGDYHGAIADAIAAGNLGAGAETLELRAWSSHYLREFADGARLADEGAARAELDGDDDARVGCLTVGGWVRQAIGDLVGAEERFSVAHSSSSERWRPVSAMWLGGLRVQQGRAEEGLELLRPAMAGSGVAPWGSPTARAFLFGAQAYAHLGQPMQAMAAVDAIEVEQARTGIVRWAGRAENTRGWILRNLGEEAAADESNLAALEHATAVDMYEPMSHAHLDLAAGAVLRRDFDAARRSIESARGCGDNHAMVWRHRMRADLYTAEVSLATGRADDALAMAEAVAAAGRTIGVARYEAMGLLLVAQARQALGLPVDLARVEDVLESLARTAGLEAWRLTADAAASFGVERWWELAERRVGALSRAAGPYAEALRRTAAAQLDRTRSSRTSG
jgi:DNA-binding SARP family transcriptional activator